MFMSMTGYGRSQQTIDGRDILVEIKSVNHRYFEYNAKAPRAYGYLEEKLKGLISASVSRGKLDVSISIYNSEGGLGSGNADVMLNKELAKSYVEALRSVKEELGLKDELSLDSLCRFPEVFNVTKKAEDENEVWDSVLPAAKDALAQFLSMRNSEGERMLADVLSRLSSVAAFVERIEELSPKTVSDYRERLLAKLNEVLDGKSLDENRVLTEVSIMAEKLAVDEETVRLKSHLQQFRELVKNDEPTGRKLDFLLQEINREINTIGSKCQDASVTAIVVDLKSEIEKIREQIQNIE